MVWDNAKWYHLAAVWCWDGNYQKIYVDGELLIEQQRAGSISWDNHMLVFGARHHNNNGDRFPMYTSTMSASTIVPQCTGDSGTCVFLISHDLTVLLCYQVRLIVVPTPMRCFGYSSTGELMDNRHYQWYHGVGDFSNVRVVTPEMIQGQAVSSWNATLTFGPDFSGKNMAMPI